MKKDNDLNTKNILIVGMDDFLGLHLVDALLAEGAHIRIYDHSGSDKKTGGWKEFLLSTNVETISHDDRLDALPVDGIYDAVKNTDIVYLLGAPFLEENRKVAGRHLAKPRYEKFMQALNLFLACREAGVSRIVQIVGNAAAGEIYPHLPVEEGYLDMSDLNYEEIRCNIEVLSKNFYKIYGLPIVTVHAQNVFGPRQAGWGKIPAIINQAVKGKRTFHLKGSAAVGKFTYVSDAVQGLILAGSLPGLEGMRFELDTEKEIPYSRLAELIAGKLGLDIKIVFDADQRIGAPPVARNFTDDESHLARALPGWSPKIDLDEGLDRTIEWMRSAAKEDVP